MDTSVVDVLMLGMDPVKRALVFDGAGLSQDGGGTFPGGLHADGGLDTDAVDDEGVGLGL